MTIRKRSRRSTKAGPGKRRSVRYEVDVDAATRGFVANFHRVEDALLKLRQARLLSERDLRMRYGV
jgi:hypothetical protein